MALPSLPSSPSSLSTNNTIEQTVTGLGYDLVDIERTTGGLLRVTIDMPYTHASPEAEQFINAEDCEKVTRQLQFVLEVEGAAYSRLEVSSPGIDRPLKTEKDFERFVGEIIDITLKAPIGVKAVVGSTISANQKKFRGTLERPDQTSGSAPAWQIVWSDEPAVKPGQKISKNRVPAPLQAMGFTLDEIHQARLAPVVDFKGRKPRTAKNVPSAQPSPDNSTS
ncbi:MAG: ribosome maturation factor RimP [Polaromonas sp.]|nr:MAG: ribosome maturation factor RimP [Polaromonas sp.]